MFAGYRFALAGIFLLVAARLFGIRIGGFRPKDMANLLVLGLVQTTLQYVFFYVGLANTTGVKGSIMNATTTFFSVLLAHFLHKNDRLSKNKAAGVLLGFIGVIIVNFHSGLLEFSFRFTGEGFIIIAALVFSVSGFHVKRLTRSLNVIVVTAYSLLIGGVFLTVIGKAGGGHSEHFTPGSVSILLYLAFLSSAAFFLWNMLLKFNKVGQVSVYNFLIPVFGSLLSALFLGETVWEVKNLIALLLVSWGIRMVNREGKRPGASPFPSPAARTAGTGKK